MCGGGGVCAARRARRGGERSLIFFRGFAHKIFIAVQASKKMLWFPLIFLDNFYFLKK